MDARQAREAEASYLRTVRRALSCVTRSVLLARPAIPGGSERLAELAQNPAVLHSTPDLSFYFTQYYRLRGAPDMGHWGVELTGYRYEVSERDGVELVAYHWHPTSHSPVTHPHLHARIRGSAGDLGKLHLPTGLISPVDIVRCLITEFGAEPLRPDWQDVLAES